MPNVLRKNKSSFFSFVLNFRGETTTHFNPSFGSAPSVGGLCVTVRGSKTYWQGYFDYIHLQFDEVPPINP